MNRTNKTQKTSIRWTQADLELAQSGADARHMSRNAYIAMAVRHESQRPTAEMKVMVQNAVNHAVAECLNGNIQALLKLEEEIGKIW